MKLMGRRGGSTSMILAPTFGNRPANLINRIPSERQPIVAEMVTFPTVRIHDLLDVVYLPCRFKTSSILNFNEGNLSEVNITSSTIGDKTCAIIPYLDAPGPQISVGGFCVCAACLKAMPYRTPKEREDTLNILWQTAVAPVMLTTRGQ